MGRTSFLQYNAEPQYNYFIIAEKGRQVKKKSVSKSGFFGIFQQENGVKTGIDSLHLTEGPGFVTIGCEILKNSEWKGAAR